MSLMSNDLGVTVDANVQPYERQIGNARKATEGWETSLKSLEADLMALEKSIDDHANQALKRQHDAMEKTGRAVFTFGAITAAAFAWSANEAVKWESAWTGVTKTTNGSAAQMDALEGQLRDLSKILPTTHEEIAAVAEAAGQLGIAREDLASFTKVAIDLGNTTNLSAEDAATSLAQLMNIMRTAPDLVDHLGNTLVALGNHGASTESQIISMALRVAGAGKLIGLTEDEVLGLSSAMANLGIQSELGGGAMQRVLLIIYTAMKEGGAQAEQFAQLAGMSADKFAAKWAKDPVRALDALFQGMGRVKDGGGNLIKALDDVGIKGTQNLQVVLRLAGAGDELTTSLDQSASAWDKNNALLREAEKRYGTTESQVAIARNELRDSAIDMGNMLLPAIAAVVGTGADLVRFWQDLPGPVREAASLLGIAATAVALFGGAALIAVPKIAAFNATVAAMEAGALKTAGLRLGAMASMLAGPWGLAILAGTVALGALAARQGDAAREADAAGKAIDTVTDTLDRQTGAITDNTREWFKNSLFDAGVFQAADKLGVSIQDVTDAALGNADAITRVKRALDGYNTTVLGTTTELDDQHFKVYADEASNAAAVVLDAISGSNDVIDEARDKLDLFKRADNDAGNQQRDTTKIWQDGTDAASELGDEVASLGQELQDLSGDYLSNRDAARQVRASTRGIREEITAYIKEHKTLDGAFKQGTKSGDQFAGLLDGLAADLQTQIDTTERLTGSQKAVQREYDASRDRLTEMAREIGMTKDEAKDYVDQVLQTPAIVETHFLQPEIELRTLAAKKYLDVINDADRTIVTHIRQVIDTVAGGFFNGDAPDQVPNAVGGDGISGTGDHHRGGAHGRGGPSLSAAHGRGLALGGGAAIHRRTVHVAAPPLDYDRLVAGLVAGMRPLQPLYGDVQINGDPTTFKEQMLRDQKAASIDGISR